MQLPKAGEAVQFEKHIKPMFREHDRKAMDWAFDLWSHAAVSEHADGILSRLEDGTMPCDGAWEDEQIDVFRRWIAGGKAA
jgi:hypothetical protein